MQVVEMVGVLSSGVQSNFDEDHPILRKEKGAEGNLQNQSQEFHEVHEVDLLDDEAVVRRLIVPHAGVVESTLLLELYVVLDPGDGCSLAQIFV